MRYCNTVPANKEWELYSMPNVPFGESVDFGDGTEYKYLYWDGSAPSAIAVGNFVFLGTTGKTTVAYNPAIAAAATSSVTQTAGVIIDDATQSMLPATAGGVWVQTKGICTTAKFEGTTDIAIGDQMLLVNAQVYAIGSGSTALAATSIGIALVAYTTNSASTATKSIYLHGRGITI